MRLAPLAAVLLAAFVAAQEKHDVPRFSSTVDLVTVDAVVLDRQGRPVRGLTAEDFTLLEDGKPQVVASFEAFDLGARAALAVPKAPPGSVATNLRSAPAAARSFVLLVDDLSLAPTRQEVVRTALARFLGDGVREGDELIFATTSGDAWWTARMPEGREDVLALAARVRGRNLAETAPDAISEWEAFRISRFEERGGGGEGGGPAGPPGNQADQPGQPPTAVPGSMTERVVQRYYQRRICDSVYTPPWQCRAMVQSRAEPVDLRRRNRTQDTLRAVDRAVFALTGERGRKALLFLTEGFLNDPEVTPLQEVAGRCREANLAVYSFDVRGLITGLAGADEPNAPNTAELGLMQVEQVDFQAAGSVSLAEETGGFAVRNTNDLAGSAVRVAEESSVYYLFGYAPPEGKGPRDWRKLKIQVKRPGLEVRARKGYTLRTIAEIAAAAERRPVRKGAPSTAKTKPGEGAAEAPLVPADVARALATAHDADAIPLRAMAYVLDERPGGTVRTVLAVEADTHSLSNLGGDERPGTALTLSIMATHRDSGKTQRIDQRILVDASGGRAWEGWLALSRTPAGIAPRRHDGRRLRAAPDGRGQGHRREARARRVLASHRPRRLR